MSAAIEWADKHFALALSLLCELAENLPGCLPCVVDVSTTRTGGPCEDIAPALGEFVDTVVPGVKLGAFVLDEAVERWLREEGLEPYEPAEGCFLALALGPDGPALFEFAMPVPMVKGGAA